MTKFLRVGAISAETVEFSGEQRNVFLDAAGRIPWRSNKFRMVYENAAGRISWRSNMLRLAYADSGSACKLAQDMVPTAHTQIDVRAQPLKNSAGRVPQAADGICNQMS
ncbi:MAG: hypothetical protein EBY29_07400 [Planctomycetes bacterium]|nr:hypothetical protein [Planctomycetota bacterium]